LILKEILYSIYSLFLDMAPYLLLGMLLTGIFSTVLKPALVLKHAGGHSWGSVVKASLFGVPLPLCSCGVLPTALYLRDAGASKPAVQSFLISTPQTGFDSIIATYGILGPVMAVYRAVSAFFLGLIGGGISAAAGRNVHSSASASGNESRLSEEHAPGVFRKLRKAFRYGFIDFIDDIGLQFLLGLVIAGVLTALVPDDFFAGTAWGSGIQAMVLMILIGVPIYMCSTSSIPIAAALMAKGISPGAAFVLLAAGPATNAATLAVLGKKLGMKETAVYLGSLVLGSLLFGLLLDWLIPLFGWEGGIRSSAGAAAEELLPEWLTYPSGVILALLLFRTAAVRLKQRISPAAGDECSQCR